MKYTSLLNGGVILFSLTFAPILVLPAHAWGRGGGGGFSREGMARGGGFSSGRESWSGNRNREYQGGGRQEGGASRYGQHPTSNEGQHYAANEQHRTGNEGQHGTTTQNQAQRQQSMQNETNTRQQGANTREQGRQNEVNTAQQSNQKYEQNAQQNRENYGQNAQQNRENYGQNAQQSRQNFANNYANNYGAVGTNGAWYGGGSAGTWGNYYAGLGLSAAAGMTLGAAVANLPEQAMQIEAQGIPITIRMAFTTRRNRKGAATPSYRLLKEQLSRRFRRPLPPFTDRGKTTFTIMAYFTIPRVKASKL